ncbi:MAG: hypothetical protein ACD_2C00148G0004, partial [uncultured bacterium (gcode 4)]
SVAEWVSAGPQWFLLLFCIKKLDVKFINEQWLRWWTNNIIF